MFSFPGACGEGSREGWGNSEGWGSESGSGSGRLSVSFSVFADKNADSRGSERAAKKININKKNLVK